MESSIDLTAASNAVLKLQNAFTSLFTGSLIPSILAVVGCGLAILLLFLALRYFRRLASFDEGLEDVTFTGDDGTTMNVGVRYRQ